MLLLTCLLYLFLYFLISIDSEISDMSYGSYFTCTRKIRWLDDIFPVDGVADEDCNVSEELSSRYFTSAKNTWKTK